jgi:hypothetical protein
MATPKKSQAAIIEELKKKIEALEERLDEVAEASHDEDGVQEIVNATLSNSNYVEADDVESTVDDVIRAKGLLDRDEAVEVAREEIAEANLVGEDDLADKVHDLIKDDTEVEQALEAAMKNILTRDNVLGEVLANNLQGNDRFTSVLAALVEDDDSVVSKAIMSKVTALTAATKAVATKPGAEGNKEVEKAITELKQSVTQVVRDLVQVDRERIALGTNLREEIAAARRQHAALDQAHLNTIRDVGNRFAREEQNRTTAVRDLGDSINRMDRRVTDQKRLLTKLEEQLATEMADNARVRSGNGSDIRLLYNAVSELQSKVYALQAEARKQAEEKAQAAAQVESPVKMDLKAEAGAAGYRIAVKQITKLVHEPLVGRFCQMSPGDAEMMKLLARSELGRAMLGGVMSVGVDYAGQKLPANYATVAKELSKEFRVSAMADTADFAMDIVMEPLRQVICDAILKEKVRISADVLQEAAGVEEVITVTEVAEVSNQATA